MYRYKIIGKIKASFNSNCISITKEYQKSGKPVTGIKTVVKKAYYIFISNFSIHLTSKIVIFHGTWVIFLWYKYNRSASCF